MSRCLVAIFTLSVMFVVGAHAGAGEGDGSSIIDKGIKALGGVAKLSGIESFSWKSKGAIYANGTENGFHTDVIARGIDHFRRDFGNDQFTGVSVVAGDSRPLGCKMACFPLKIYRGSARPAGVVAILPDSQRGICA